jgi:3-deoxy-D-manno-octulosonate 8-phosphate phosphatase (KDO 8-P phosphatase)
MRATSRLQIKASLKGKIKKVRLVAFDFDGVFTDNMVYVSQDGSETVCCSRSDGIGLRKLESLGIQAIILSSELNPVVMARSRKLGIRCEQGCDDKRLRLEAVAGELRLSLDQIAFVGNDINDLDCLSCVGLPIIVRDAHPDVSGHALYRTKQLGGRGAVREVCDLFEQVITAGRR